MAEGRKKAADTPKPKATEDAPPEDEVVDDEAVDETPEVEPKSALDAVGELKDAVKEAKTEIVEAGLEPLKDMVADYATRGVEGIRGFFRGVGGEK